MAPVIKYSIAALEAEEHHNHLLEAEERHSHLLEAEERHNHLLEAEEHHNRRLEAEERHNRLLEAEERHNRLLVAGGHHNRLQLVAEHHIRLQLVAERHNRLLEVVGHHSHLRPGLGRLHSHRKAVHPALPGFPQPFRLQVLYPSDCTWSDIPAFQPLILLLSPEVYSCVDLLKAICAPKEKERLSFFDHENDFSAFLVLLQDFVTGLLAHLNNGFTR